MNLYFSSAREHPSTPRERIAPLARRARHHAGTGAIHWLNRSRLKVHQVHRVKPGATCLTTVVTR